MISFDTGLLRPSSSGDAIVRHQKYAQTLKRLDIIVLGKSDDEKNKLADNSTVYGVGNKPSSVIDAWKLACKLMDKYRYDLVDTQDPHLTGMIGCWLKGKYGIKFELHFHGDFWKNPKWVSLKFKNKIFNLVQKRTVSKADAIRVVNRKIKEKLMKSGISSDKIKVINTPVDTEKFAQNADTNSIESKYGKKILLYVGRLVPVKNLPFLLEAIKKVKEKRNDFVFLAIGEGSECDGLIDFVNKNNLQDTVHFLGPKNHDELISYYKAAYLFLLMSVSESFGKVIIEAGLTGTPSLASRTLGPGAIIEDGKNGWLVDINDMDATVRKINELLDNDSMVKEIGQKIEKDFAKDYSREQTFEKVGDFWLSIVNDQL